MKIALVHDFIKEYGGAERVLREFSDMYPKAPIYTAFRVKGSTCDRKFADRKIVESKFSPILKIWKLYSPLRFLIPLIWSSMDLSEYDLVITSASSYVARGFKTSKKTKVICYCHTPPKYLYGYTTSIDFQKYFPVRVYAHIVNHFLRIYDFNSAQEVDYFIANSKNVKNRIQKHYRKDAKIIYPPIEVKPLLKASKGAIKENYFFIASRLVGGKGIEDAAKALSKININLKIAGEAAGFSNVSSDLKKYKVEVLGRVSDKKLFELYAKAKGFIALERDVDFGMTPVEAMAAGTPVIALDSGGYRESVIDGKTGILINNTDTKSIGAGVERFNKVKWNKTKLQTHAKRFNKERFRKEITDFVIKYA